MVHTIIGPRVQKRRCLCGRRQRRIQGPRTPDHIFRCDPCNLVYTDDPAVGRSRCPQCGKTNEVFEF